VVNQVLGELGATDKPVLHVFNKTDLLAPEHRDTVRERVMNLVPNSVFVNTAEPDGLDALRRELLRRSRDRKAVVELRFPSSDGRTLAEVYRDGDVMEQRIEGETIVLLARLDAQTAGRLNRRMRGIVDK
jgi:GTP-binding protein HflX